MLLVGVARGTEGAAVGVELEGSASAAVTALAARFFVLLPSVALDLLDASCSLSNCIERSVSFWVRRVTFSRKRAAALLGAGAALGNFTSSPSNRHSKASPRAFWVLMLSDTLARTFSRSIGSGRLETSRRTTFVRFVDFFLVGGGAAAVVAAIAAAAVCFGKTDSVGFA